MRSVCCSRMYQLVNIPESQAGPHVRVAPAVQAEEPGRLGATSISLEVPVYVSVKLAALAFLIRLLQGPPRACFTCTSETVPKESKGGGAAWAQLRFVFQKHQQMNIHRFLNHLSN